MKQYLSCGTNKSFTLGWSVYLHERCKGLYLTSYFLLSPALQPEATCRLISQAEEASPVPQGRMCGSVRHQGT